MRQFVVIIFNGKFFYGGLKESMVGRSDVSMESSYIWGKTVKHKFSLAYEPGQALKPLDFRLFHCL